MENMNGKLKKRPLYEVTFSTNNIVWGEKAASLKTFCGYLRFRLAYVLQYLCIYI